VRECAPRVGLCRLCDRDTSLCRCRLDLDGPVRALAPARAGGAGSAIARALAGARGERRSITPAQRTGPAGCSPTRPSTGSATPGCGQARTRARARTMQAPCAQDGSSALRPVPLGVSVQPGSLAVNCVRAKPSLHLTLGGNLPPAQASSPAHDGLALFTPSAAVFCTGTGGEPRSHCDLHSS
jgi:hypothetical protein